MKKILFRADAQPGIGTGDLVSLLNLAKYFENSGWDTCIMTKRSAATMRLLEAREIKNYYVLDTEISLTQEIKTIAEFSQKESLDALFFEITERNLSDYKGLPPEPIKACVSFNGAIPDDMDLVVGWDIDAGKNFDTTKYPKTKFLLGVEYVILPLEFRCESAIERPFNPLVKRLLIAMGGSDEFNFTQKVVESLMKYQRNLELQIVIGSGYQFLHQLETFLASSGLVYEIRQNVTNMLDIMLHCDFALAAGGLTAFELLVTRTPSALIATYEHQIARCEFFKRNGLAKYLGFRSFDQDKLFDYISRPLQPPRGIHKKTDVIRQSIEELYERRAA